ncbi:unnamed protein product [Pedinophyceae sp. YPF-701]|nr:unnamed protein product [Pedinophyceae sp. YPF-701]
MLPNQPQQGYAANTKAGSRAPQQTDAPYAGHTQAPPSSEAQPQQQAQPSQGHLDAAQFAHQQLLLLEQLSHAQAQGGQLNEALLHVMAGRMPPAGHGAAGAWQPQRLDAQRGAGASFYPGGQAYGGPPQSAAMMPPHMLAQQQWQDAQQRHAAQQAQQDYQQIQSLMAQQGVRHDVAGGQTYTLADAGDYLSQQAISRLFEEQDGGSDAMTTQRRRRMRLAQLVSDIGALLPGDFAGLSRNTILQATRAFLREWQEEIATLRKQNERLRELLGEDVLKRHPDLAVPPPQTAISALRPSRENGDEGGKDGCQPGGTSPQLSGQAVNDMEQHFLSMGLLDSSFDNVVLRNRS